MDKLIKYRKKFVEFCFDNGYDDSYYYNNVMPEQKCPACQQSSNDLGTQKEAIQPKHNPNITM